MRGKIIDFEGLDASFKETNVKALHTYLLGNGIKANYVSFPRHNTAEGAFVDKFLQGKYGNIDRKIVATMFALDRFDYTKCEDVAKRVEQGEWFIFDRYTPSSVIYQTAEVSNLNKRRNEQMDILEYEYVKLEIPEPDIVLAMYSDYDMMLKAIKDRGEDKDIFESNAAYLKKVHDCFTQAIDDYDWVRVNTYSDLSERIFKSKITLFEEIIQTLKAEKIL